MIITNNNSKTADIYTYREYIKALKYVWDNCTGEHDGKEIEIKYNDRAGVFIYKKGNVSLTVTLNRRLKIFYEVMFNNMSEHYTFEIKDNIKTYTELQYCLAYHFSKLIMACYAATVLKSEKHKMNTPTDILEYYEEML